MTNPTAPSERLLYPDLSSVSERLINEKIQANNKFNNNINIIKDIRNYYETETNNYNKKLSRYKNYINIAETTEIVLSSIATTATTTSVSLTGIGLAILYQQLLLQQLFVVHYQKQLILKLEIKL